MDIKVDRKRKLSIGDESKDCGERGWWYTNVYHQRARNLYQTFFWCTLNASWLDERCIRGGSLIDTIASC